MIRILTLTVLACGVLLNGGCQRDASESADISEIVRPVRYAQVSSKRKERIKVFSGVVRSASDAIANFNVSGTIKKVAVTKGQRLEKGDLIAILQPQELQQRVEEAKAEFDDADAQLRNATLLLERVQKLYGEKSASGSDLDSAKASLEEAVKAKEIAAKQLEIMQRQLSNAELLSPAQCKVTSVNAKVDDVIGAGDEIAKLNCGKALEIEAAVPEVFILNIKEGQTVKIRFEAMKDKRFSGKVIRLGVAASGPSTFPVIISISERDRRILPGMSALVEVELAETEMGSGDRLYIPVKALKEDRDGYFVYVVTPEGSANMGTVRRQNVSIGGVSVNGLEILSGLGVNDRVVTAGLSGMRDGLQVRLLD